MNTNLNHLQELTQKERNEKMSVLGKEINAILGGRAYKELSKKEIWQVNKNREDILEIAYPIVLAVHRKYSQATTFSDSSWIVLQAIDKWIKKGNLDLKLSAFIYFTTVQHILNPRKKEYSVREAEKSLPNLMPESVNSCDDLDLSGIRQHLAEVTKAYLALPNNRSTLDLSTYSEINNVLISRYNHVIKKLKEHGVAIPELKTVLT